MRKLFTTAATALAIVACSGEDRVVATAPTPPANASVAFVTLSGLRPAAGDTIIVTVRAGSGEGAEQLGSFSARLFPGPGLRFVGESPVTDGARAMRASGDTVFAAGASPTGYGDGRLFAIRARVMDPARVGEIELLFTEVTSTQFVNQDKSLKVESRLFRENR